MPDRLTGIVTRCGDDGTTALANGQRRSKADRRIEALGAVDELNSHLGLLLSEPLDAAVDERLAEIQHDLFDLGAALALPGRAGFDAAATARLEAAIAELGAGLGPLREFILPGGTRSAALAQVCRSVCRRAERRVVELAEVERIDPHLLPYLNRLSDLLFVLARYLNHRQGRAETFWRGPRPR